MDWRISTDQDSFGYWDTQPHRRDTKELRWLLSLYMVYRQNLALLNEGADIIGPCNLWGAYSTAHKLCKSHGKGGPDVRWSWKPSFLGFVVCGDSTYSSSIWFIWANEVGRSLSCRFPRWLSSVQSFRHSTGCRKTPTPVGVSIPTSRPTISKKVAAGKTTYGQQVAFPAQSWKEKYAILMQCLGCSHYSICSATKMRKWQHSWCASLWL